MIPTTTIETTCLHDLKYRLRFRYFMTGHRCKYKNQKNVYYAKFSDLMLCDCNVSCYRVPRLWWKPFIWLGNRNIVRYDLDRIINLFIPWKGKTLKERWNFWGGGGIINNWCRKYLTYD